MIHDPIDQPGNTLASAIGDPEALPTAPAGAPNVVVIVLDDTGFGQLGCFGSDIETPNLDRLAAAGLRFNNFHVTALCSPTRASLLTGRNHHAVGMGMLADISLGFPGYTARIPKSAAGLPRILKDAGWSTMAVGKWHLTPRGERTVAGPFDHWPSGQGFEHYYGFLHGGANCFTPNLVSGHTFIDPPRTYDEGYHLCDDLADQAIRFVQDQKQAAPEKPFFLYYGDIATHAPHHIRPEWAEQYSGRYDDGWDAWRARTFDRQKAIGVVPDDAELPPRPSWVPSWESLDDQSRTLFSRMHEIYAAYLTHADEQIGRVIDFIDKLGQLDNTVIVVMSDNGASAEGGAVGSANEHRFTKDLPESVDEMVESLADLGGPKSYNHYAWGWAWAGNTPFRLWKRYAWLGGTRTPLIVHWPDGIDAEAGAVADAFCHAIDLAPTILDACGITAPAAVDGVDQKPIDGASLSACLADAAAPAPRDTQYFEMLGSRSIYHDGWRATTDHVLDVHRDERELLEGSRDFATDQWQLFHVASDFAETEDRAEDEPKRLQALVDLWWAEAQANQVLPLDDSFLGRLPAVTRPAYPAPPSARYFPGGSRVPDDALPLMLFGFDLRVDVESGPNGPEGVLVSLGDWNSGLALYVVDGHATAAVSLSGDEFCVTSPHQVQLAVQSIGIRYGAPTTFELMIDGEAVAGVELPRGMPNSWQNGGTGLRIGADAGLPVTTGYTPPFPWTGAIDAVHITTPGAQPPPVDEVLRDALRSD